MPTINIILKSGKTKSLHADEGWSLMEILREAGIKEIQGICGGCMACATCHIYVHPDWFARVTAQDNEKSEEEEDMLDTAFDVRQYSRLGCQIRMSAALDGLVLAIPGATTGWPEEGV
ncbi:MAG: 2Fe-2S iron-sulfur cluster binding domain-containing protein [Alphaproteobacteria bacterium]|nr:2Fe-2S iron-sulfur cluster binding domain-containing protein [Alphaproteobacteria bacterium]